MKLLLRDVSGDSRIFRRPFLVLLILWLGPGGIAAYNQLTQSYTSSLDLEPTCVWSDCNPENSTWLQVPGVDYLTYRVRECNDSEDGTPGGSKEKKDFNLSSIPRLSRLEVCKNDWEEQDLYFVLSMSLEDIVNERLTAVRVTFKSVPDDRNNNQYITPVCRQFDFSVSQSQMQMPVTPTREIVHIPYECLAPNLYQGKFSMSLSPLPWSGHVEYRMWWQSFYMYSEVDIWDQLMAGAAPVPQSNQIFVVFQPPKSRELVDSLLLELLTGDDDIVNSTEIGPTGTNFAFDHDAWGSYRVKITPRSAICQMDPDVCASAMSQEVLFFGQPQQPKIEPIMTKTRDTQRDAVSILSATQGNNNDDKIETGMKLFLVAGSVSALFLIIIVIIAIISRQWQRKRVPAPTLHLISPNLSPLEKTAVRYLAMALSSGLRITVTFTCQGSTTAGGHSNTDQFILTVHPDTDSTSRQEMMDKPAAKARYSKHDILALVSFSNNQDNCGSLVEEGYDDLTPDVRTDPALLDIVAGISAQSYKKIIFIQYTNQTPSVTPALHFSISQSSGNSEWDAVESFSDQLTSPLRPPKKPKASSSLISVCQPHKYYAQKLPLSCKAFCFPHQKQYLYSHLKTEVSELRPWHKFSPMEDVANDEKWTAAHSTAKSVLNKQSLFLKEISSDSDSQIDLDDVSEFCYKTVDRVSMCGPDEKDVESLIEVQLPAQCVVISEEKQRTCVAPIHIFPPRDQISRTERFDCTSDCDSFTNFSEMRRDLFS